MKASLHSLNKLIAPMVAVCISINPAIAQRIDDGNLTLTPGAHEAADLINVGPWVQALLAAKKNGRVLDHDSLRRITACKLAIYERIWEAHMEVRGAAARIDKELAYGYDVESAVQARRDRNVQLINTFNFVQGGTLSCARTGIVLNSTTTINTLNTSNYIRIVSSSMGIGLSLLALGVMQTGSRRIDEAPNSLAGFFSIEAAKPYYLSGTVWNFINAVPPGDASGETRREKLVKQWHKLRHFNPNNEHKVHQIAAAPQKNSERRESLKIMNDRVFMLHDIHATIEQLDQQLYELHKCICDEESPAISNLPLPDRCDRKSVTATLSQP